MNRGPVRLRTVYSACITVLLLSTLGYSWGNEGHIAVNKTAAQHLPKDMPDFFRKATDRLAYIGPEPDRWREVSEPALKYAQEPDHFIDLERVADLAEFPHDRYLFYRWLYQKRASVTENPDDYLPERVGLQPYAAMETYDRLKVAFREYRRLKQEHKPTKAAEANAVFYAGWLGHYVADAANPLHTTIQYNGWVGPNPNQYTTSKEFHWLFEGPFVSRNLRSLGFTHLVQPPHVLREPFAQYISYIRESNSLVEQVYQLEKAHGLEEPGSSQAIDFVRRRLAVGTQMLLNLWYTAWLESAKPVPPRTIEKKPAGS